MTLGQLLEYVLANGGNLDYVIKTEYFDYGQDMTIEQNFNLKDVYIDKENKEINI